MPNPIMPRNWADPAGTKSLRDRAVRESRRRFQRAAKLVNDRVKSLPHTFEEVSKDEAPSVPKASKRPASLKANVAYHLKNEIRNRATDAKDSPSVNSSVTFAFAWNAAMKDIDDGVITNARKYTWLVDDNLMNQTMNYISAVLADAIVSGDQSWSFRWWFNVYVDSAYEMGTSESIADAKRVIAETSEETQRIASIITAETVLNSPPYRRRLNLMHGRVFEEMAGIQGQVKSDLRRILTDGMARGLGIRDLTGQINDRIGVGLSRAERIARTEINKSYSDAYMAETDEFNDILEEEGDPNVLREMHVSALSPTTRESHARRHGKIYTHEQQSNWWDSGSNRIHCLCTVVTVLVNRKTGKVNPAMAGLVKRTRDRGDQYFKVHGIIKAEA